MITKEEDIFEETGQADDWCEKLWLPIIDVKAAMAAPSCVYCDQDHHLSLCKIIMDADQRKQHLEKSGRCFICLKNFM